MQSYVMPNTRLQDKGALKIYRNMYVPSHGIFHRSKKHCPTPFWNRKKALLTPPSFETQQKSHCTPPFSLPQKNLRPSITREPIGKNFFGEKSIPPKFVPGKFWALLLLWKRLFDLKYLQFWEFQLIATDLRVTSNMNKQYSMFQLWEELNLF